MDGHIGHPTMTNKEFRSNKRNHAIARADHPGVSHTYARPSRVSLILADALINWRIWLYALALIVVSIEAAKRALAFL